MGPGDKERKRGGWVSEWKRVRLEGGDEERKRRVGREASWRECQTQ